MLKSKIFNHRNCHWPSHHSFFHFDWSTFFLVLLIWICRNRAWFLRRNIFKSISGQFLILVKYLSTLIGWLGGVFNNYFSLVFIIEQHCFSKVFPLCRSKKSMVSRNTYFQKYFSVGEIDFVKRPCNFDLLMYCF